MNTKRIAELVSQARSVKDRFTLRAQQWAVGIKAGEITTKNRSEVHEVLGRFNQYGKKTGGAKPIHRSQLPEVTPEEHRWLMDNGYAGLAKWTRFPDSNCEGWLDTDPMASSRNPVIREITIGQRSLGCVASDSDEESDGLARSQEEQEDAREITDLLTLTYQDAPAFDRWLKEKTDSALLRHGFKLANVGMRRRIMNVLIQDVPCDCGEPLKCMIEDPETGEYRPLMIGDTVQVAWGSNEDLDALFLEESDDPRKQNDVTALSDHRWSDSFREPTDLEYEFHHGSHFTSNQVRTWVANNRPSNFIGPRRVLRTKEIKHRYVVANSALDDVRWQPTSEQIRKIADRNVQKMIEAKPELAEHAYALTLQVEEALRSMAKDVRFDHEQAMVGGYFLNGQEYFETLDENRRRYERIVLDSNGNRRPGAMPPAVDYDALRTKEDNRKRQLEQHRNQLKAQLVPPPVAKTGRH